MARAELTTCMPVAAPADVVWAVATDWERQSEWMLGTTVRIAGGDGGAGTRLIAVTGIAGIGAVDTMEIVELTPTRSCRVRHTGELINGEGGFRVIERGEHAATFLWWEDLALPRYTGWLWPAIRPGFSWGLRRSLAQFAELCARQRP